MKTMIAFLSMILLAACSKEPLPSVKSSNYDPSTLAFSPAKVRGKRVKELLVVIFKSDFTADQWKLIFDQTRKLSENKKSLRAIEGALDDASNETRLNLLGENADLLLSLADQSAFIMSWSTQDENCSFSDEEAPRLQCRPFNLDNVMNGGMPESLESAKWVVPNPIGSQSKIPYLSVQLSKRDPSFQIELRLSKEANEGADALLKGEALPSATSEFKAEDGSLKSGVYPYGYAELLLGD